MSKHQGDRQCPQVEAKNKVDKTNQLIRLLLKEQVDLHLTGIKA